MTLMDRGVLPQRRYSAIFGNYRRMAEMAAKS